MSERMNKTGQLLCAAGILFSVTLSLNGVLFAADAPTKESASQLLTRAKLANGFRNYDEAIAYADKAIQSKPDYAEAYNERGMAYAQKNQKKLAEKAIQDFDMAIKLKPDYVSAYMNRGNAKSILGQHDSNIEDQNKALKLSPQNAAAYRNRGAAYYKKKMCAEAIANYSISIQIKSGDPDVYNRRAKAYFKNKNYDAAVKDCTQSINLDPAQTHLDSHYVRSMSFKQKGQINEAIEDMKKTIELNPAHTELKKTLEGLEKMKEKKEELETPAKGGPMPTGTDTMANVTATQPAAVPSSPAPALPQSTRVLTAFTGYAVADPCAQANTKLSGVPWRTDASQDGGTVSSAQFGQYQAMLRHTLEGLRLLYGPLSADEDKSFNAFWAPFFDHPTKTALEYFNQITPLLDDLAVAMNNLNGMLSALGTGMQEMLLVSGDPASSSARMASAQYVQVKAQRVKSDGLVKKIEALGNPPNPLAAKCAARKRHRNAMGSTVDILEAVKSTDSIHAEAYRQLQFIYAGADKKSKGQLVEMYWEGNTFHFSTQGNDHFNYESPDCSGSYGSAHRHEITGTLSADGSMIEKVSEKLMSKSCRSDTKQIVGPTTEGSFEAFNIPMVSAQTKPEWIKIVYSVKGNAVNKHLAALKPFLTYDYHRDDEIKIVFEKEDEALRAIEGKKGAEAVLNFLSGLKSGASQPVKQEEASGAEKVDQANKKDAQTADPEKDPAINDEAIAEHLALAEQTRRDADRWAADAAKETNADRRKELESRAANMYANAQSEKDIADSLRTGTLVHTRTEWDERQHQELVASVKKEVATFAMEDKLLSNIPKVGDMIAGIDGVELREQSQQRITEALQSPDRLQKLAALYTDLQNKVINQGEQQMTAAQDKVKMWDNRIAVAENVQFAASTGIMLAGLWAPAEIGSLALGYAGSTGFAEDGVKGATVAVVRSVSMKADAIISAYEGAIKIDPDTGKPAGAWGALEGALWSISTNEVMGAISNRLQKFKADSAPGRLVADGGTGFEPINRANNEARIKEYDFKTPEERFKTELASATTPAEQAAVNKKYAIQVERENMHQDSEAALKKAEDAIRKGEDPAKAKKQYNNDLDSLNEKYKDKTRNQEHKDVMESLGFDYKEPTPEQKEQGIDNRDIKPTGSDPKTAASDMDFTPQGKTPHEAYQKGKSYVDAMKKRGHNVDEYGDRWVDNTNDATIWKPGFGTDKPGSSSFDAEVIFGTLPHSDKFGTKGGIEWTSSSTHTTDDPLGAVLANAGKAAAAGLGNSHPNDFHTIGKSAAKAVEVLKGDIEVDPQLKAQIEALKAHKTPEQAGVVQLGAEPATKKQQEKDFLAKVEALMGRAYHAAKEKSEQNAKSLEQQANAAGNSEQSYDIRTKLGAYKAGNNAALTTIAQASPGLGKVMASTEKASDLIPGISSESLGGFSRALFSDRDEAAKAPPPPANAGDPAFSGLGKRCKEGAKRVQDKLNAAKPGTDEAKYLSELKTALDQGEKNPAEAVRSVRGVSGTELAVVLAQLGVSAGK